MPAFTYKRKPLANMAAFKANATFGFWDRVALATGKEGAATGQYGRVGNLDDLPNAATFEAQIREAVARIDAEVKPARAAEPPKPEADVPPRRSPLMQRRLPPRILRMDRRGQAAGDQGQARRRSGGMDARRQAAQLEIRELLSSRNPPSRDGVEIAN
nr:hypothetical protein [Sphingomonas sp. LM7]